MGQGDAALINDGEFEILIDAGVSAEGGKVVQYLSGYVDGDLRQEARFNYPFGIHYDEVNKIFYIGDIENYRIRNIAKDE